MKNCIHSRIIIVTETPKGIIDGIEYVEHPKIYIKCADCGEILPINIITKEDVIVPLTPEYDK